MASSISRCIPLETLKHSIPSTHEPNLPTITPPSLGQLVQNRLLQRLGFRSRPPPLLDLPILANQKLLKVPRHLVDEPKHLGFLRCEPLVQRNRTLPIDIDLAHDGERDAVVDLAELLDLVVGARLLARKLVAGEAEDDEVVAVLLADRGVQLLEARVLARQTAVGGRVDDEDDLAFVVGEGDFVAAFWRGELIRFAFDLSGVGGSYALSSGLKS